MSYGYRLQLIAQIGHPSTPLAPCFRAKSPIHCIDILQTRSRYMTPIRASGLLPYVTRPLLIQFGQDFKSVATEFHSLRPASSSGKAMFSIVLRDGTLMPNPAPRDQAVSLRLRNGPVNVQTLRLMGCVISWQG